MTTFHSKPRHPGTSDGQPGSVVWFISFGDLLTLLLCFFLVLTPWDDLNKAPNAQSLKTVTDNVAASTQAGIPFASDLPLRGSVIKLELPLFEGTGTLGAPELSPVALSAELKRAMPKDGRVEVLVCSGPDERADVVRYVGEVFDRSFGGNTGIRFLVRRSCDASQVLAPVTKKLVGRIRIVGA